MQMFLRENKNMIDAKAFVLLAFTSILLLTSCQAPKNPDYADLDIKENTREVQLVVRNHNWQNMAIYIFGGQGRKKLGVLTSQQQRAFVLGKVEQLTGGGQQLTLLADPIGGGQPWVQRLHTLSTGDIIEWTVGQPLYTSSVMVY